MGGVPLQLIVDLIGDSWRGKSITSALSLMDEFRDEREARATWGSRRQR